MSQEGKETSHSVLNHLLGIGIGLSAGMCVIAALTVANPQSQKEGIAAAGLGVTTTGVLIAARVCAARRDPDDDGFPVEPIIEMSEGNTNGLPYSQPFFEPRLSVVEDFDPPLPTFCQPNEKPLVLSPVEVDQPRLAKNDPYSGVSEETRRFAS